MNIFDLMSSQEEDFLEADLAGAERDVKFFCNLLYRNGKHEFLKDLQSKLNKIYG